MTNNSNIRLISNSVEETERFGEIFAASCVAGDFIALFGSLGAGKTAFVRGFVRGCGDDTASSPTFSIVHEYSTIPVIYHMDLYRISGMDELEDIGYEDYLNSNGIVLMEWAERIQGYLNKQRFELQINADSNGYTREINIKAFGKNSCERFADIQESFKEFR